MNQRESSEIEGESLMSLKEKQRENQELLIRCIAHPLGFSGNIPLAACVIYKCLLDWQASEVEGNGTITFDRIIHYCPCN